MKKIAIITPTFNRANTLFRAYYSLQKQTYQDFYWLILDDGSTDNTEEVVAGFIKENTLGIVYQKGPNRHKFLTVIDGIKKLNTPYFIILDSDDCYPEEALEILIKEAEKINPQKDYIAVMGLSADEEGKVIGDLYPGQGFDGSIFEMRYKYKVRGDKNGLFFTKAYQRAIEGKNYSQYEGKGYIPHSLIFNDYDANGQKTRFINKIIRYYLKDEEDAASISNTRWSGQNLYGLSEGYLSFLNAYDKKLFLYPKVLLRNLIGFQIYALKSGRKCRDVVFSITNPGIKILGMCCLPFSYFFQKMK